MNDLIPCIIFAVIGIVMIAGGIYLAVDWDKRTKEWASPPTTNEYFSCLFEGWLGVMSVILGVILLLLTIIVALL